MGSVQLIGLLCNRERIEHAADVADAVVLHAGLHALGGHAVLAHMHQHDGAEVVFLNHRQVSGGIVGIGVNRRGRFHRFGCRQRVVMDTPEGQITQEGTYLFSLAASGQFYGGGYHAAPTAQPDDGLLDFVLVDRIGRLRVPGFLKRYRAGEPLSLPIVHHFRGTRMQVFCDEPTVVTADGECFKDTRIEFELVREAFRFVVPAAKVPVPVPVGTVEC